MTIFRIIAKEDFDTDEVFQYYYDNSTGELSDIKQTLHDREATAVFDKSGMRKSRKVRRLKIQMGLSCNYECGYCSQRYVPRAEEGSIHEVDNLMAKLESLDLSELQRVEFWGGEPFVYWKTLKPLAERIGGRYPNAQKSVITNGSLLDEAKVQWLIDLRFGVAISHDGPMQHFRGPDPLDDPKMRELWRSMWYRMGTAGHFTFNAMLHGKGSSRAEIYKFFVDLTGDENVKIGEGGIIDAYDHDGLAMSLQTKKEHFEFRQQAFRDWIETPKMHVSGLHDKIHGFITAAHDGLPDHAIGQKCNMDAEDVLAIDMVGNVVTCQNVSAVAVAQNGESHLGGHISDIENVRLKGATHWRDREHCSTCPVLQLCQGNCMFLQGENWYVSCENQYSDAVATMAAGFFSMTKRIPILIEPVDSELPLHRRDIWGSVYEHKESTKRVIPVKEIK